MATEKFVVASDYHGDRRDPGADRAFRLFVEDFAPDIKVFAGDLWDFRALRVGADRDEKMASMKADFNAGMEFLEWYRPDVLVLGNHDQRLWDAIEKEGMKKTGPIPDYAGELIVRFTDTAAKLGINVLPYDKRRGVWAYKGLKVVHGFDGMNPENMAAVYGNVLYGHGHRIEAASAPGLDNRVARMIGCLCLKDMNYNRHQTKTLAQQHGWAYGVIERANRFGVMQAELIDGAFSYANEIKTVRV
jgi:predicted phosphodiesterase